MTDEDLLHPLHMRGVHIPTSTCPLRDTVAAPEVCGLEGRHHGPLDPAPVLVLSARQHAGCRGVDQVLQALVGRLAKEGRGRAGTGCGRWGWAEGDGSLRWGHQGQARTRQIEL
jgi:hypothetical protein